MENNCITSNTFLDFLLKKIKSDTFENNKSCVPVEVQNLIGMPYLFAFLVGVSTLVKVYTMSHESSFSPKVNPLKQ